jgi:hypothetical protein
MTGFTVERIVPFVWRWRLDMPHRHVTGFAWSKAAAKRRAQRASAALERRTAKLAL